MTPSILFVSFLFAVTATQPAPPTDATPAAKPAMRACANQVLPQFQTPSIPVSFQVPAKQKRPQPFSFAEEAKKFKMKRDCDGTVCGCDIAEQNCITNCNGDPSCEDHCGFLYTRCSICCCCDCPRCPLSCGC